MFSAGTGSNCRVQTVHNSLMSTYYCAGLQKTRAFHKLTDDVSDDIKKRRHLELDAVYRQCALERNQEQLGLTQLVLIEGVSIP